ncbi:mitochondrial proton/calcium exchanger protein [Anoplophora glabripennis]|uniref:mitochondrial proton/calcium exchanger protein n=1 Tax=Anoplophora glabripennis TaxID=217634 RepID=UPI0008738A8C|nr:mitochondrial proton/calcium exchanger protein [Anoplophora glabripennis]
MYVVLRSPHIRHTRSRLLKSCRYYHLNTYCFCNVNLVRIVNPSIVESKRLHSISSHSNSLFNNDCKVLTSYCSIYKHDLVRHITISSIRFDKEPLKPSSKVEVTVQELKKKEEELKAKPTEVAKPVVKKSIVQKVWNELVHYYHGFRLLFMDVKISSGLVWRILNGNTLTRREYRLLTRTVGDLFRLVPFSVFIIVPFMELLLPVFIKLFPGLLPSTFQTATEKEDKIKQNLKVKLEMAKFLQGTLDEMSVQHNDRYSDSAKEFLEWFNKVRTSGELVSTEEIMKFSKLFEDEITLDSLSRSQLIALCRVLDVQTLGTNNFLRFQLRMKLRSLAADDKMIQKEGVDSLTLGEMQQACRARGMRAYGVSEQRLRSQLLQWLDLSLNEKVPPSLLLLSSALMLPETIPTSDKLKATISALPETIVKQTQAAIGEKEGKIDNRVRAEILREEEKKIKEERAEQREEKKKLEKEKEKDKEILVDKAPVISATTTPILEDTAMKISAEKLEKVEKKEEHLQSKDFEIIEHAIDAVSKEKKFIVEKEELQELKAEMADYKEDVEDLAKAVASQPKPEVKETKAAKRLFKSVNKMIDRLDNVLVDLEKKEKQLKKDLEIEATDKKKEELLQIDDIISAIHKIKDIPDQSKVDQIKNLLKKMDADHDGSLKIDDVLKVIEIIGKENVKLSPKQMEELIDLVDKEGILEVEDKIEKALQKDKEAKDAEKVAEKQPSESKAAAPAEEKAKDKTDESQKNPPSSKPKMDAQSILTPPPSIDPKSKSDASSKML